MFAETVMRQNLFYAGHQERERRHEAAHIYEGISPLCGQVANLIGLLQ